MSTNTVRTRLLIMSDTHTASPLPPTDPTHAYRLPLPKADVLLHAGDITKVGYLVEYQAMFEMLRAAPAELKLVIPGNHDITLHEDFYVRGTGKNKHIRSMEDVQKIRELWTGYEARSAGIVYLEEGVRTFELGNGATFTVSGLHFHLRRFARLEVLQTGTRMMRFSKYIMERSLGAMSFGDASLVANVLEEIDSMRCRHNEACS